MSTTYSISKSILVIDEQQMFVTYGIVAKDSDGNKISEFSDVSVNKSFTERVVGLLNDYEVEPCHFFEVVLDELNR